MIDPAVVHQIEDKMKKAVEAVRKDLSTLRTGRASAAVLDKIMVSAYGTEMPLKQLAGISVPEARLIVVTAFDKSTVASIEKAILKSELGLTPNVDGATIRLPIPALTEERRKDLVKQVKKRIEDAKVSIRNIRRDGIEELKGLEKAGTASEDENRRAQDQVQKLTDRHTKELDDVFAVKEKEIMEV